MRSSMYDLTREDNNTNDLLEDIFPAPTINDDIKSLRSNNAKMRLRDKSNIILKKMALIFDKLQSKHFIDGCHDSFRISIKHLVFICGNRLSQIQKFNHD